MADGRANRKGGYPTRWTEESCKHFFQMLREKKVSRVIGDALGYSKGSIDDAIVLLSIVGPEAFIRIKVYQEFTEYDRYEKCCIVETMLHQRITNLQEIAAYFKIRPHKLKPIIEERRSSKAPLDCAVPLDLPPRVQHEFYDYHRKVRHTLKSLPSTLHVKAKAAKAKAKTKSHSTQNKSESLDPYYDRDSSTAPLYHPDVDKLVGDVNLEEEDFIFVEDKDNITMPDNRVYIDDIVRDSRGYNENNEYIGKATVFHRKYRGQPKLGSLDQEKHRQDANLTANKACSLLTEEEIDEIKKLNEEIQSNLSRGENSEDTLHRLAAIYSKTQNCIQAEQVELAQQTFNEMIADIQRYSDENDESAKGVRAKDLDISKWYGKGRRPIVDIDSEGFDELPQDIKEYVMRAKLKSNNYHIALLQAQLTHLTGLLKKKQNLSITDISIKKEKFLVAEAFRLALGNKPSVSDLSRWSGLTRREYSYYQTLPLIDLIGQASSDKYNYLKATIHLAFVEGGSSEGASALTYALQHFYNVAPGVALVRRLMEEIGIKPKMKDPNPQYNAFIKKSPYAAQENTHRANAADRVLTLVATDITLAKADVLGETIAIYLSVFYDIGAKKILSIAISYREKDSLVVKQLRAIGVKLLVDKDGKIIVQSDNGHQYGNIYYVELAEFYNIVRSNSVPGNVLDNAIIEALFAIIKGKSIEGRRFQSVKEVIASIIAFIRQYNSGRRGPVPSVYGSYYPRPEIRHDETQEDYEKRYAFYRRAKNVQYKLLKGEGTQPKVKSPPSYNHVYQQVINEIVLKDQDTLSKDEVRAIAKARFDELVNQALKDNSAA